MNPTFMWVQAIFFAVACALLGFTAAYGEALVLALLLAAEWVVLVVRYRAALDRSAQNGGTGRGPERRRDDRRVGAQALIAVGVGLAAGVAGRWLGPVRLWHDRELLSVCVGALAALACSTYASSVVDWFHVRPRIDGIVREPPCRSSGDEAWGDLTRLWYLHRGLAEMLGILAVIVAFSALVGALIAGGRTLPTAAAVAIPTGATGALVLLTQTAISTLRNRVANRPWIWVGDELRDGDWRAYVLHVTVRGVLVREWDADVGDWGREREITHERLDAERVQHGRFAGCATTCSGVNPACARRAASADAPSLSARRLRRASR